MAATLYLLSNSPPDLWLSHPTANLPRSSSYRKFLRNWLHRHRDRLPLCQLLQVGNIHQLMHVCVYTNIVDLYMHHYSILLQVCMYTTIAGLHIHNYLQACICHKGLALSVVNSTPCIPHVHSHVHAHVHPKRQKKSCKKRQPLT